MQGWFSEKTAQARVQRISHLRFLESLSNSAISSVFGVGLFQDVASWGRDAGCGEVLGQPVGSFPASVGVHLWIINWIVGPLQVAHEFVGQPRGREFSWKYGIDETSLRE